MPIMQQNDTLTSAAFPTSNQMWRDDVYFSDVVEEVERGFLCLDISSNYTVLQFIVSYLQSKAWSTTVTILYL